ncbi:MAG: DUF1598 domain-containing protein [Pirellulaceae bacterium]
MSVITTNDLRRSGIALLVCSLVALLHSAAVAQSEPSPEPGPAPPDRVTPFPATTVQLPTFGVAIDAEGVLSLRRYDDPGGRLRATRVAAARSTLPDDVLRSSDLRKVSLVKLEKAIREKIEAGEAPDETMRRLAGLLWVQYVFFYPDEGDIVLAGPAEGWIEDAAGRAVGASSGRPVLLLEDLIVALRAYAPGRRDRPFIGCTIDPDREGLARLKQFQSTVPRVIPQSQRGAAAAAIAKGMRDSLGMADIRVFGISEKTHAARVLIEADYRMKLIGIGLEPPPVRMTTFMEALKGASHSTLQRWWFTPNYGCVKVTPDHLAMELIGEGVQLLGEDKLIGDDGSLAAAGARPNKASELFTTAFTNKYPEIAEASPVYAQMRSFVDLLVTAAFIRSEGYYDRSGWRLGVLADEKALPVETHDSADKVMCAVNSQWKGSRLFTPAGGGVSIRAHQALADGWLYGDQNGKLADAYDAVHKRLAIERWWWD